MNKIEKVVEKHIRHKVELRDSSSVDCIIDINDLIEELESNLSNQIKDFEKGQRSPKIKKVLCELEEKLIGKGSNHNPTGKDNSSVNEPSNALFETSPADKDNLPHNQPTGGLHPTNRDGDFKESTNLSGGINNPKNKETCQHIFQDGTKCGAYKELHTEENHKFIGRAK